VKHDLGLRLLESGAHAAGVVQLEREVDGAAVARSTGCHDLAALRAQGRRQMLADETVSAGDERTHA
jgi:hypothetical protein